MSWLRSKQARLLSICIVLASLSACKVLTIEEDQLARAQQSGNFDVASYVSELWPTKVTEFIANNTQDIVALSSTLVSEDISQLGGRQAGEGSPWTFIVHGEGTINELNNQSRQGSASLVLENGQTIDLMIGPVIFSTAIRDALPFINFNDFANQIVYAEVGNSLTAYALDINADSLQSLSVGNRISFSGVFAIYDTEQAIRITPISLQVIR